MANGYLRQWDYTEVTWADAHQDGPTSGAWRKASEVITDQFSPVVVVSVGQVLKHDRFGILLCFSRQQGDEVDSHLFIPREWISRVRKLR